MEIITLFSPPPPQVLETNMFGTPLKNTGERDLKKKRWMWEELKPAPFPYPTPLLPPAEPAFPSTKLSSGLKHKNICNIASWVIPMQTGYYVNTRLSLNPQSLDQIHTETWKAQRKLFVVYGYYSAWSHCHFAPASVLAVARFCVPDQSSTYVEWYQLFSSSCQPSIQTTFLCTS